MSVFALRYSNNRKQNTDNATVAPFPIDNMPISLWHNVIIHFSNIENSKPKELDEPYFIIFDIEQYYHLLIDQVAIYWIIKEKVKDLKPYIIIDNYGSEIDTVKDRVNFFIDLGFAESDIHIINLSKSYSINFKKLYVLDIPENRYDDVFKYDNVFKVLRNKYYVEGVPKNKFYISRKNSPARRLNNEKVIEEYFKSLGFEVAYLENMSFSEQKDLFSNAKVVIGSSGSGFTNILFTNKNCRIIDINHNIDYYGLEWRLISDLVGCDYNSIYVGQSNDADFILKSIKRYLTDL